MHINVGKHREPEWHSVKCVLCRSVVKYGGVRVSQVKPSNCFMRLEKLVLPSIFDTSLSSMNDDVKLAELSNNSFEWKNVTFFRGGESKHTLTPTYFQGVKTPNFPRIYAPEQADAGRQCRLSLGCIGGCTAHVGGIITSPIVSCGVCLICRVPRAVSGVVRIDPLRFLAECHTRRLNQV